MQIPGWRLKGVLQATNVAPEVAKVPEVENLPEVAKSPEVAKLPEVEERLEETSDATYIARHAKERNVCLFFQHLLKCGSLKLR